MRAKIIVKQFEHFWGNTGEIFVVILLVINFVQYFWKLLANQVVFGLNKLLSELNDN